MRNGSVRDHLSTTSKTPLSWSMRLKVAQDASRGLAYLHEYKDFQVVRTMVCPAPEYIRTSHLTSMCDVWSYGVILYELITGRLPLDRNRPKNEQKLLEWVKPYIRLERFELIIDSRLEGNYSLESAKNMSFIANRCLTIDPNSRPKMSVVLAMVNQLIGVPSVRICGTPRSISKRALEEKGEVPTYIEEKWSKSSRCGTLTPSQAVAYPEPPPKSLV